jgi:hypothetical protein
VLLEIHVALFGNKRRVRGNTITKTELISFAYLFEVRRIKKELHHITPD